MRYQNKTLILILILTVLVALQMMHIVSVTLHQLHQGANGLSAIRSLKLVFSASEFATIERGPSGEILGDALPHDPAKLARLEIARKQTDLALSEMAISLEQAISDNSRLRGIFADVRNELLLSRQMIDAIANLPRDQRSTDQIRSTITQMILAFDNLQPVTLQLAKIAQSSFPTQTNYIFAALSAADLRVLAERLGLDFTVALTMRKETETTDLVAIFQTAEQIERLLSTLIERVRAIDDDSSLNQAVASLRSDYFQGAIPYIKVQLTTGLASQQLQTDAAEFTKRYMSETEALVALRNILIDEVLFNAGQQQERSLNAAYLSIFWSLLTIVLSITVLVFLEFRLRRPLREASRLILEVAYGRLDISVPTLHYKNEASELLSAIKVLKDNSVHRVVLETERQQLLLKLKDHATTDYLTGLLNRRGFFDVVEPMFRSLIRQDQTISVLMFDIDHFKSINDIFGHEAGDIVLKKIAQLSKAHLRSGDVVARYGGEEFLVFMPYCGLEMALVKAEELREKIELDVTKLSDGREVRVTASFGVAQWLPTEQSSQKLINRCDENLYAAKNSGRNKICHCSQAQVLTAV